MADSKITALTALTTADPANDMFPIVDVSDTSMAASGTTKRISINNLLAASGTATLASATITGDLTVDTSTLKVDSANNRVIVGHTSGSSAFQVTNAGAAGIEIQPTGFSSAPLILSYNRSAPAYTQLTLDGSTIVHALSGSTAMTLNATGLGVGGSPNAKVSCAGFSSANVAPDFQINRSSSGTTIQTGPNLTFSDGTSNNTVTLQNSQGRFGIWNYGAGAWNERLSVDSSGNIGIGVTPSAYSIRSLEIGAAGNAVANGGISDIYILAGAYYNAGWKYSYNATNVSAFEANLGKFVWKTALGAGKIAGDSISFTDAMTLDASGNLLIGKSVSLFSTVGVEASGTGFISATNSESTNATTNLSVYSTGAAAFRFYVGLGGTVFATNTTISAISDARLKENVQDIDVGLGAILALKPRKFDWKEGKGKDIKGDRGFIAQEFEQVFPNLIDEWKDSAPEGEAPYKSVRQDLIPVLVKAIQELTARVQTLETR